MKKLRRASSVLKRVPLSLSEERAWSPRIPCFRGSDELGMSKISSFYGGSCEYARKPPAWGVSLRNHTSSVTLPAFADVGKFYSPRIVAFGRDLGGLRCFSAEEKVLDLQKGPHAAQAISEAQAALMDYLHYTRSLQFTDAEHISKNSPIFLGKLLQKVKTPHDIGHSLTRFLHFHPINEFEPFFESLGLKPPEFNQYLPRGSMFLSDDSVLLENYQTLCNYGIARQRIGKIFKEATEIFHGEYGVLSSKLRALEEMGLSRTSVISIVSSSPSLLIGDVDREFVKVLEELESMGVNREWIGEHLSEEKSYHWGRMLILLQFFREFGLSRQETGVLIRKHPGFLLDDSGKMLFSVVGLLMKLGGTKDEFLSMFLLFPAVQLGSFVNNLHFSLQFLVKIEMDPEDIRKVVRSHPHVLGSCFLKTPYSVITSLRTGKKRLCRIIKEDPHQFKKWVLGRKIDRLPSSRGGEKFSVQKEKFLLSLGFVKNTEEFEKALATFRGKHDELQDRYDCFVNAGLDPKDVSKMIRRAPHILNQTIEVLESKIDFLINGLGYPLDSLIAFPAYMSYTVERVKLRFLMYNWLKDEGKAMPNLALSTILATAEKGFTKRFVKRHANGPQVWERFKRALNVS